MLPSQFRQFLRLQRLSMALAGFAFGILVSVFSNWLYEHGGALVPWMALVAVVSGLIGLALFLRQPADVTVEMRAPITLRSPDEAALYARRGFVGFVPLYTPKHDRLTETLTAEERAKAIEALDWDRLCLEESNLQPTIHAIASHASRLEHCWLLATVNRDPQTPGSLPYARLLAEYLRQRKGLTCQFHYGPEYSISLEDDALVLNMTYDRVRQVFQEAERQGIPRRQMIADITTGIRSMPFGMVLACLSRDQDIEFVGTRYDERGQPTGTLFPVLFGFEPVVR